MLFRSRWSMNCNYATNLVAGSGNTANLGHVENDGSRLMRFTNLRRLSSCSGLHTRRWTIIEAVALSILLGAIGSVTLAHASHVSQSAGIKGQVVADIPEKRRPLPGVVVNLSGERLADKNLQIVSDEE